MGAVHLMAHSMGNRALVRALAALPARRSDSGKPFVNHVVLTAPDIDAGVFRGIADAVKRAAISITLYASSNDQALRLSKQFHGYPRAGEAGKRITIVDGISTVDAPT
jgi:esterase/lipase superfamily enzyme